MVLNGPTDPQIIFQEAALKSERTNAQASRVMGRDRDAWPDEALFFPAFVTA